jgi:dihydroflavonol-4-reductase
MAENKLVLVTGVSGYISAQVAATLLRLNYRVRGTVRSTANEAKIAHLKDLSPGSKHKIELVEADLTADQGWDAAVADVDYIMHIASPFPIEEVKDKSELIVPAVEGTLRVFRAAAKVPSVKRIVLTSSTAAIAYGQDDAKTYTDTDWTVLDDAARPVGSYVESKTRAELAAWDFLKNLPEGQNRFELAVINPTLVEGPIISKSLCSSVSIPKQILLGELPVLPDITLDMVSIHDVVRAHIKAMTEPKAAGQRFMLHSCQMTMPELSRVLVAEFKPKGYRPTTMGAPNFLLYLASFFDNQAKMIVPMLGKRKKLQPQNVKTILGLDLDSNGAELIKQTVYSAIQAGIIVDKSPDQSITKTYVVPPVDITGLPFSD